MSATNDLIANLAGGLLDISARSAAIFAAAALATLLMRRQSAAMRHLLWTAAAAMAVLLPAVSPLLPAWRIKLPAPTIRAQLPSVQHTAEVSSPHLIAAQLPSPAEPKTPTLATGNRPLLAHTEPAPKLDVPSAAMSAPTVEHLESNTGNSGPTKRSVPPISYWLVGAWAVGAMISGCGWIAGLVGVRMLGRRAAICDDARLNLIARRLADQLRIRRRIVLLLSDCSTMPMTWGLLRPRVVLPAAAVEWSSERIQAVLMHEFAHIGRCDFGAQALGHLARAIYWINPLAWWAQSRLRVEQDRACDDIVLAQGAHPTAYAEDLILVARTISVRNLAAMAGVAMARQSHLRSRVAAILDSHTNRRRVSPARLLSTAVVGIALLLPLSAFRLGPGRQATAQTAPATRPSSPAAIENDSPLQNIARGEVVFQGRYVAHNNNGAQVDNQQVSAFVTIPKRSNSQTKTDADGAFTISGIPAGSRGQIGFNVPRGFMAIVSVRQPQAALQPAVGLLRYDKLAPGAYTVQVDVFKAATLTGIVTDEKGVPIDKTDVIVEETHRVFFTDPQGRYKADVPPIEPFTLKVGGTADVQEDLFVGPLVAQEGETLERNIKVQRRVISAYANELTGVVVDAQGNPVAGADVYLGNHAVGREPRLSGSSNPIIPKGKWTGGVFWPPTLKTDENGRFDFDRLDVGNTDVWAQKDGRLWAIARNLSSNAKELRLVLETKTPEARVEGVVSDTQGQPMARAKLYLFDGDYSHPTKLAESQTNADGTFSLLAPPNTSNRKHLSLIAKSADGRTTWQTLPRCSQSDVHLVFSESSELSGRVVDKRGNAIAGARVWIYLSQDPRTGVMFFINNAEPLTIKATTDADGRFTLRGIPAGNVVSVFAKHPQTGRGERWYVRYTTANDIGDIVVADGITLAGTIKLAADGAPAADAEVSMRSLWGIVQTTKTDAAGRYRLGGLQSLSFDSTATVIAKSRDGLWEGESHIEALLQPGDVFDGLNVSLTESFESLHRKWLSTPGRPATSAYRAAVFEDTDPVREGKDHYDDTVTLLDGQGKAIWQIGDMNTSYGEAILLGNPADHSLWVAEDGARRLTKLSADGKIVWRKPGIRANAMAVDPASGDVTIALTEGTIYGSGMLTLNRDGEKVRESRRAAGHLVYSAHDHSFWTADRVIAKLSLDGVQQLQPALTFPWTSRALAANDKDGSIWVVEGKHPELPPSRNRLFILGPDGAARKEMDLGEQFARDLVVGAERGSAWLVENQQVKRLDLNGALLGTIPVQAQYAALEPDTGYLWLVSDNGIYRLDTEGRLVWSQESPNPIKRRIATMLP